MIDQENIYQLLHKEKWTELIDIFYNRKNLIKTDILLQQASETTINVMVEKAAKLETNIELIDNLSQLHLLHVSKYIELNPEQEETVFIAIANAKRDNISFAYNYAKGFPENELAKVIIKEYQTKFPIEINNSLNERVLTTENLVEENANDLRKSMFNSYQETEFFLALKRVFDTYQVYPNVALSTILDYDSIKNNLNYKENDFFLKTTIDFVVFEPFDNYFPIYFFELDSPHHDKINQKEKDRMKDKIFSLSGQKLYRIRKRDISISVAEFESIIIEIRDLTK